MTQEQIDAAEEAIVALDLALAAATDLTDAQKLDATVDVTVAKRKVASAQETLDTSVGDQRMKLTEAANALAGIDLDDLDTQEKIDAANAAIRKLGSALNGATHLSASEKAMYKTQLDTATETVRTAETGMARDERMATQRTAITNAVTAATTAVGAVNDTATDEEVDAANTAIAALEKAIADAEDLPEGDTGVAMAQGTLTALTSQLSTAKTSRTAAMKAKADEEQRKADEEKRKADAAMMALAQKLHDGISAPGGSEASTRTAMYAGTNDSEIAVTIGNADAVNLKEDKKTTVAALNGWEGKQYTLEPTGGGSYTAVVYSNVGKATEGAKFSATYAYDVKYPANAQENNELSVNTSQTGVPARIASSSFDQSAGKKEFEAPSDTRLKLSGTYHGVSGNYYCAANADAKCTATVAAEGFTLTGGTWSFRASNKDDRLMDTPDADYESYGWWIHKSADGKTYTASAFVDNKGASRATVEISELRGTAKYVGGAAGKYALYSATGGTNDAGDFTAKATLDATFGVDHTITGTIDSFMGADGKSRDWSVELNKTDIADNGAIDGTDSENVQVGTVWTIGTKAAAKAGQWSGSLQEEKDDVPTVATGTFHSKYGTAGEMVGAFGANQQ